MRLPMIAGNWKMNTTPNKAIALVKEMIKGLAEADNVDRVICPPFVSLYALRELLKETSIELGAQNLFYEEKGAYTGEISPPMLAELCRYVIIGHSERRRYFNETGNMVNKKVKAALHAGLKPILCIGENLEENDAGRTDEVVTDQLRFCLNGIQYHQDLIVAYEPVWAIGTGRAATSQQANETAGIIRGKFSQMYGESQAEALRILYGGSVTAANTAELMAQPEIDGGLVGGASLKADEFLSIVRQTSELYR